MRKRKNIFGITISIVLVAAILGSIFSYCFNSKFKSKINNILKIEQEVPANENNSENEFNSSNSEEINTLKNELQMSEIKINKLNNELNKANEKISEISFDNLIINGNFTINQRQLSSYERVDEDIYTADRWGIFKGNGKFNVVTHTLEALDETSPTVFGQWIENAYCLAGNNITVSATLNDVRYSKTIKLPETYVYGEDVIENIYECDEFVFRIYFYVDWNVEKSILGVQFILQNGNTLKIDKVKVEDATFETRYIERSLQEETALCQRYFQRVNPTSVGYGLNETSIIFFAPVPVTMKVLGKISVGSYPSIYKDGVKTPMEGEIKLQSNGNNGIQFIYKPTGGGVIKYASYQVNSGNIYLDADYYTKFTI